MHSRLFRVALPVLLFVTEVVAQQHTSSHSQLDQYVEQVSELSSRARANVYFTNPQSIFRGVQVNFVNIGAGNLTFLRRDLVAPGRIPLVFARVYDSSGQGSVEFGPGWTLSAAETIVVSESRAQLLGENGSPIDFVKTADREFKLEKDFPSDYSSLRMIDEQTIETSLRTGFTKQFQLIEGVFRLTRVTDRNGNSVRLTYRQGLLARIANEDHSVTITRNGKGRIISAQDGSNRRVQFSYDSKGRLIEADDLGGQPWTYQYNDDDRLLNARDPLQRLNFGASYDDKGHVGRLQLPSGSIQFDFNPVTHTTTIVDRKNLVSRFFQNEDGITVRVTNPLNEETAIGLDNARNVISLSRNGAVIERMEFDSQHRLIARHSATDTGMIDREYSYDPVTGLLSTIRSSDGHKQSFSYDANGNLRSAALPTGEIGFKFSERGDLVSISENQQSATFAPDPGGLFASMTTSPKAVTKLQYNSGNELREITYPGGVKSNFTYQPSGLRSSLALSSGGGAEYSYDPAGNLTESKVFDKKHKQTNGQKLEMDSAYQLTRWTLFDGTVTEFKYDPSGNLTEIKKGSSLTRFEYDEINRLIAVTTPDGQRLTYTYKPGERSLIEQHQHAAVSVDDLRDTGLTFSSSLQVSATRAVTGLQGAVRFSETLGTFQLSGSDGTEVVEPHEKFMTALSKLFLFNTDLPADSLRFGFNIPFNTMFMPAEYKSINCCPVCTIRPPVCDPCFPPPPPPDPPTISGSNTVWWLNGQSNSSYPTQITLTSSAGSASTWSVTAGATKINLQPQTGGTATVSSTGTSFSTAAGDVTVTVTDSTTGLSSSPFAITTRTPSRLTMGVVAPPSCDPTFGYQVLIPYTILDNLSATLGSSIGVNEKWTTTVVADFSGTNWRRGAEGGTNTSVSTPSQFDDQIQGENLALPPVPVPDCSSNATPVEHWGQSWGVGSSTVGLGSVNGVLVQNDTIHKFKGKASVTVP